MSAQERRVIIMGAAGRDFHDFNVYWKHQADVRVVCFTAAQIPNIDGRVYPPELAGARYPGGIPIHPEEQLERLIREHAVNEVALAYSDLSHEAVMHQACRVQAAGADFRLLGPRHTMLRGSRPVIAICAVRTGCGKSQTARRVTEILRELGQRVAVVRHPMPYGDLRKQVCQRFATLEAMDAAECTIEEREEYEPHISAGSIVFAGVDYEAILRAAEREADVILWDGGNNDLPFFEPTLHITIADPHRAGHETRYFPGETNVRMADIVIVNKIDTADGQRVEEVEEAVRRINPRATLVRARSPVSLVGGGEQGSDGAALRGKRVLCIEDGPTVTHGEMGYGAARVAAERFGAREIVDPRPFACGSLVEVFRKYVQLRDVLPAMGYGAAQMADLEASIERTPCDVVLIGTPIDLGRILRISKPAQRVRYELEELDREALPRAVRAALAR